MKHKHAEAIVREVKKPDRLFERTLHRHCDVIRLVSIERHRDTVGIGGKLDTRRLGEGEAPAGEPGMLDQQELFAEVGDGMKG